MEHNTFASTGVSVARLGLGCMGMSDFYAPGAEAESIATIHRALDLGCTFLDTADIYGVGRNEELVGKAIANGGNSRRGGLFLATKFGNVRGPKGEFLGVSGKPEYVRSACEASLKRLKVEVIDLYYQHRVDPATPIEDTVGAMADLIKEGKVRFLGLSEAGPATIRRAHAIHPIAALQTEYSLWTRDPEAEILPVTRELGIAFVPYSPLGRGFLTGQFRTIDDLEPTDWRRNSPRFQGENFQRNLELVKLIEGIAARKGCKASQLALAWLLAQGEEHGNDVFPIPGTKRIPYLEENIGALSVELTRDDLTEINCFFPLGAAAGQRYPEAAMRAIDR